MNSISHTKTAARIGVLAALAAAASAAAAHDGHGPHVLHDLLTHPFGTDDLLVLLGVALAVGALWMWRRRIVRRRRERAAAVAAQ